MTIRVVGAGLYRTGTFSLKQALPRLQAHEPLLGRELVEELGHDLVVVFKLLCLHVVCSHPARPPAAALHCAFFLMAE